MKHCFSAICCLSFLMFTNTGRTESEYEIRSQRIADQLSPSYRPPDSSEVQTELPKGEEVAHSEPVASAPGGGNFHFSIGTRILYVALLNDTQGAQMRNSFIGSIYKIEANQDYLPLRPYAQVTMRTGPAEIGLGLSYDQLEVATVDNGGGDGDIEMESWMIYLLAAYPNESRFTPFGELGLATYRNSFDPISSWSEDGKRRFALDDSQALYVGAGCDIRVNKGLSANLYLRYVDVDVDGDYVYRPDSRAPKPFTFTLEHIACGVGVKYVF